MRFFFELWAKLTLLGSLFSIASCLFVAHNLYFEFFIVGFAGEIRIVGIDYYWEIHALKVGIISKTVIVCAKHDIDISVIENRRELLLYFQIAMPCILFGCGRNVANHHMIFRLFVFLRIYHLLNPLCLRCAIFVIDIGSGIFQIVVGFILSRVKSKENTGPCCQEKKILSCRGQM